MTQIWAPKIFSWILPLLYVRHCCKLSLLAISRKINERNLRKWQKNLVLGLNLGPKIFFHEFYLYYMLDIVASYHCMQLQGKLMSQTWENGKKPSFRTNFDPFGPNLGPKIFFHEFYLYYMLDIIVASYHHMQFQGQLMNQTRENGKKPSFRSNFGLFGPNFSPKNFFHGFYHYYMLYIVANYHYMQFQG